MIYLLYQIFAEPMVTMRTIQTVALIILLLQVAYIFFIRSKTMIPFQIINFMLCTLYVHALILFTESDLPRKKRIDSLYEKGLGDYFEWQEDRRDKLME